MNREGNPKPDIFGELLTAILPQLKVPLIRGLKQADGLQGPNCAVDPGAAAAGWYDPGLWPEEKQRQCEFLRSRSRNVPIAAFDPLV